MEKTKKQSTKKNIPPSELRFDIVSKDWVVIATGRAKKPGSFKKEKHIVKEEPKTTCPFCHIETQGKPFLIFSKARKIEKFQTIPRSWDLAVIPNKYPAVVQGKSLQERAQGPYQIMDGIGFHEVVVTRDHQKDMSQMDAQSIKQVFDAYQERYLELMNEEFVNYVSIFHNHGYEAGASISHPHSQIMAIPVTDPDIENSIAGSRRYWNYHKKCIHCVIIKWDKEDGQRIVFENKHFIALCPFASRMAFTVRIYPKDHLSYFERVNHEQKQALAEVFQQALFRLGKALARPAYNFFLRTSPCDGKDYSHYHWHIEIMPRTSIQAGFEFGAGIEISTIEPEKAANYLREQ